MRSIPVDKTPKPNLDLNHLKQWLGNSPGTIAIEIGCGVGLHPIRWAKENPNGRILAIERTKNKFSKFASRLKNHSHLTNIYPAHSDAANLVPHLNLENTIDDIFIFYPNPYPKTKHKNLRFAFSTLTPTLVQALKIGGRIHFATNEKFYALELKNELNKSLGLELIDDSLINSSSQARTHFEKKYLERGEPCFNIVFLRICAFTA